MRIVLLLLLMTFSLAEGAFAKKDPNLKTLEDNLAAAKTDAEKAKCHLDFAVYYLGKKDSKCDTWCKSAIKLAERHKLDDIKAQALSVQGEYYFKLKKYSKAAGSYLSEYSLRYLWLFLFP